MTPIALLDTTIVIAILRNNANVIPHANNYLNEYGQYCFSIITQYEVLRGFYLRRSTRQHILFDQLCLESAIVQLDKQILEQAAVIYADLYRRGQLIDDADILIAATALVNDWRLITDNERHLRRIPGLTVENWLSSGEVE